MSCDIRKRNEAGCGKASRNRRPGYRRPRNCRRGRENGLPEPVTAVPKAVATPVPRPDTPVETGNPVPLVSVTDEGMPRAGVVSEGETLRTTEPDPVDVAAPVPPCGTDSGVVRPESDVMLLFAPAVAPVVLFSSVPLVGSVMLVEPVVVSVSGFAPDVVRLPPSVIVLEFATPVPPLGPVNGFTNVRLLNVGVG